VIPVTGDQTTPLGLGRPLPHLLTARKVASQKYGVNVVEVQTVMG
jgi:hypothetical protein